MTEEIADEAVVFLRRQFNNPDEWCDLNELHPRLLPREGIEIETVGIVYRENNHIIGAILAYRNPFSHDEWTLPMIAVEQGDQSLDIPPFRNQGIGKSLTTQIFQVIKELGGKAVLADTNLLLERGSSKGFPEACGFKLIGEIPGYFVGDPSETGLMYIHHL